MAGMECPVKSTCAVYQNIMEIYQDNAKLQAMVAELRNENQKQDKYPPPTPTESEELPKDKHYAGNSWDESKGPKPKDSK